jgi:Flagellar hook-length control protein FliK
VIIASATQSFTHYDHHSMDITQLTQNLVKGLEQKNAEQLTALSRVLNMVVGKMIIASVTETAPVTIQEQQELLKQTLEALAQFNKLTNDKQSNGSSVIAPAIKAEIARLTEQVALIKSPRLMWASLLVNDTVLLTYTDKALQVGEKIPLQLATAQKLTMLAAPENRQEIISENLRNILPHKDIQNILPHKDIQTVLYKLASQWQAFPKANRQALTSPNIDAAIKQLSDKIVTPLQLSLPSNLKSIIKNSGIFFERKINSNVQDPAITNHKPLLNAIFSQDVKGTLLHLANTIYQELNNTDEPLTPEQSLTLLQRPKHAIPNELLARLSTGESHSEKKSMPLATLTTLNTVTMLNTATMLTVMQQLMTKPVKELSDKELRTQLLTLLQQHSLHSLAKIQLQQLTSLQQQENPTDSVKANASWNLEIPVKYNNDVQQLHLHIRQEWIEEKSSPDRKPTIEKVKQWSVTLGFDLPTLGEFCAQFSIVNSTMSAIFWAAQDKTLLQVKSHMDSLRKQLEHEGIQVTHLQCLKGMPPEKPIALGYSLIDVST